MDATQALTLIIVAVIVRDGLLGWALINWVIRASVPAPVVPVPGTPPGPGTPPVVVPPPVVIPPPAAPRFTGITATSFGGAGDSNASAYGGMVDPDKPGFALPYRFTGTPPILRAFHNGKTVDGRVVDVGPWNINDPYWTTGSRPEAESGTDNSGRKTNLAGIDLTPAAWTALGVSSPNSVKAQIDWDFVSVLDATATTPTTGPAPTAGTPPWVTLGRTYVEKLTWSTQSGAMPAQMQAWMDNISTTFPEMAPYCKVLKNLGAKGWWAWCGFFVQAMLSYSHIRGPMSAAGLQGDTTTNDWAYAKAWANWGTDASDNPQPGDVLVWSFGHVSFYDHLEPDTDTYSSLGGDQGTPLRVCLEDISIGSCIAIRRPPAPTA